MRVVGVVMTNWNLERAFIPNIEGLAVDVLLMDGTGLSTVVERVDGMHKLRGVGIMSVKAWRRTETK